VHPAIPRALLAAALTTFVIAASLGCAPTPTPPADEGSSVPESSVATETVDVTATVESLKDVPLAEGQEGMLFQYVRAGGLKLVKDRFGEPTTSYTTFADDASGGSCEFADGRAYRFQYGWDQTGKAVVMCHVVEMSGEQTATAGDQRFVVEVVDGKTTLEAANTFLRSAGAASVTPASSTSTSVKVPAYAWYMPDGSGFSIVDLTSLDAAQMEAVGMADSGPYQGLYWDATHMRTY
jgi:hypothetical protein